MKSNFNIIDLQNVFVEDKLIAKFSLFDDIGKLEKFTKKWATSLMISLVPYDLERSGLKRGKYLSGEPKNKANKFCHYFEKNDVVAILEYIDNYDLPASFIVFENLNEVKKRIYKFDIEEKLEVLIEKKYDDIGLESSCYLYKNGNYVIEKYTYKDGNIAEIDREHKDKIKFSNLDFFPNNIYKSKFILKYDNNNISEIDWNGTPDRSFRKVFSI